MAKEVLRLENEQFENEIFKLIPLKENKIPKLIHQIC